MSIPGACAGGAAVFAPLPSLEELAAELASGGVGSAVAEARIFLEEAAAAGADKAPEILAGWIKRRFDREPLQYIIGKAWFRDLEVEVTPAVLIPRPETELILDRLLRRLPQGGRVLDIGTGSGVIAISAATERPDAAVTAVDISPAALEVARRNGEKIAPGRVEFLHSDLFSALEGRRFDMICANLPYVTREEYQLLDPEVKNHEPVTALVAGDAGLALIISVIDSLAAHLLPGGEAVFEMSPPQTARAAAAAENAGFTAEILRDLTGRERFVAVEVR